jgi:drug/metabolite transporter (DMT)-like permease
VIDVGILVAFISAVCAALALVLQAIEARHAPHAHGVSFRLLLGLLRRPRWLAGTVLVIIAWPLQVVALSYAPITVVQPILASFQLVLLGLARLWLRERVGRRELAGALAIVAGVTVVIIAAPQHSVLHPAAGRLAWPLAIVGGGALVLHVVARNGRRRRVLAHLAHHRSHGNTATAPAYTAPVGNRLTGLELTIGAGLGYAWVDFADKLLSNAISAGETIGAVIWVAAIIGMGLVAFTSEQTALQRRPASTVGPLIGALEEPLPVLLALIGGVEVWHGGAGHAAALAAGLALVGAGAIVLARSPAVTHVTEEAHAVIEPAIIADRSLPSASA